MQSAESAYRLTARFPKAEVYAMTSQIRRSAASIAANIAEGHGRESGGVFVQFLRVSQGSLKELETHLMLAVRVNLEKGGRGGAAAQTMRRFGENGEILDPVNPAQRSQ